jgi:GNAT superfamily N-acetyltransferase
MVATVPKARRQGIGTAMTLAACRKARALGYHIAALGAQGAALRVYQRIGFREYCRMSWYTWTPETVQGGSRAT